jgi:hypothetical protein
MHLVLEGPTGEVFVNLSTGRRTVQTLQFELWSDRDFHRAHILMRAGGEVADAVFDESVAPKGPVDPAFTAFWSGYREAIANGDAKVEGEGTVGGRPVYWLRFASFVEGRPGTAVAIDRRTYKPVVIRNETNAGSRQDSRVLVAETIPYDPADFKRIGRDLLGSLTQMTGSGSVRPGSAAAPLEGPWLTLGKQFAEFELTEVNRTTTTDNKTEIEGVDLVYTGRGNHSLTISELGAPDDPAMWKHIPRGSISIHQFESGRGPQSMHRTWSGSLVKHGVYVTIDTDAGEDVVLAAARALRPAR